MPATIGIMRWCPARFFALTMILVLSPPFWGSARAMDRDVRTVLVSGMYGAAAGTLLGLASASFTPSRPGRTLFMGTSIGLYLGLAVGAYTVLNRDDPGNPFTPYIQKGEVEEREPPLAGDPNLLRAWAEADSAPRSVAYFAWPVLEF